MGENHRLRGADDPYFTAVRQFRIRAVLLLTLRNFVRWGTLWLVVCGVGVVVTRTILPGVEVGLFLAIAGAGMLAILLAGTVRAHRHSPDAATARAVLDYHNRCGGLLMAGYEHPVGGWRGRVAVTDPLSLRWRGTRPVAALTAAGVFVVASALTPVDSLAGRDDGVEPLNVARPVGELRDGIEMMRQADWMQEQEAQMLFADLDRLEKDARGNEPTRTWEALDHMHQRLDRSAEKAAEQTLTQAEATARMRVLAEALSDQGGQLTSELRQWAMEELADSISEALQAAPSLSEEIGDRFADAFENGTLSPEQLRELAERLQRRQEAIERMMRQMHEMDLVDADTLRECLSLGQCEGEGFCEFVSSCEGTCSFEQMLAAWMLGAYGISDEGGLSPMTFSDTVTDETDARFEPRVLPSDRRDVSDSLYVGKGVTAPEVDDHASASVGGLLDGADADGGQAHQRRVLPRHRMTVQRYFDRDSAWHTQ